MSSGFQTLGLIKKKRQHYCTMSFTERYLNRVTREGKSFTAEHSETAVTGSLSRRGRVQENCRERGESERGLMCLSDSIH